MFILGGNEGGEGEFERVKLMEPNSNVDMKGTVSLFQLLLYLGGIDRKP